MLLNPDWYVGWPTIFKTRVSTNRRSQPKFGVWLDDFLKLDATLTVSFDGELEAGARRALEELRKGRHPASLNFGDCMN